MTVTNGSHGDVVLVINVNENDEGIRHGVVSYQWMDNVQSYDSNAITNNKTNMERYNSVKTTTLPAVVETGGQWAQPSKPIASTTPCQRNSPGNQYSCSRKA